MRQLDATFTCWRCHGTGDDPDSPTGECYPCDICNGNGWYECLEEAMDWHEECRWRRMDRAYANEIPQCPTQMRFFQGQWIDVTLPF